MPRDRFRADCSVAHFWLERGTAGIAGSAKRRLFLALEAILSLDLCLAFIALSLKKVATSRASGVSGWLAVASPVDSAL